MGITYAFDNSCDACKHGEPYYCENFNPINFGGVAATDGTTRLHQDGRDVSMFFGQSSFATHSVAAAASGSSHPGGVASRRAPARSSTPGRPIPARRSRSLAVAP